MAKEKVLILYLDWFRTDPVLDGKVPLPCEGNPCAPRLVGYTIYFLG